MTKPTQHLPHTAVSPCSQGALWVLDNKPGGVGEGGQRTTHKTTTTGTGTGTTMNQGQGQQRRGPDEEEAEQTTTTRRRGTTKAGTG